LSRNGLAIQGGQPAFPNGPPAWPIADAAVQESVNQALASGQWGVYEGDLTLTLQQELQKTFKQNSSLLSCSGTISVELALRGVGVKADDEVILSAYDFPGNFRAIEAIGAMPVLVDVVQGGQMADIEGIVSRFATQRISVVEDVCQSPGGLLKGRPLGSFGNVATLSFGGSKLLSAGRGGAILSNDESIIQRAKIFAHRGNDAFPLSQLQAAVVIPQLDQLHHRNQQRHVAAKTISDAINQLNGLRSLELDAVGETVGGFYKLPVLIEDDLSFDRANFLSSVQAEGIAMDVGFRGFAKRSQRRCRRVGALDNAVKASSNTMLLHHPILLADESDIEKLIASIGHCYRYCLDS